MFEHIKLESITKVLVDYGPKVIMAVLVLYFGFKIIGWIANKVNNVLAYNKVDATLRPFLASMLTIAMKIGVCLFVAGMFGFQTTSLVAVVGAMTFAVGMALQGNLGNFASGVMILLFKPYKVGDLIKVNDFTGQVSEIQIFNTLLLTPDNRKIIIPNGSVTDGAIENITGQETIRVDMTFGISYDDDIDHARDTIMDTALSCEKILKSKPIDIFVTELGDSSVNFVVRPWCNSADYWDVYFFMQEHIKKNFDKNHVNFPYPTMDLNLNSPVNLNNNNKKGEMAY